MTEDNYSRSVNPQQRPLSIQKDLIGPHINLENHIALVGFVEGKGYIFIINWSKQLEGGGSRVVTVKRRQMQCTRKQSKNGICIGTLEREFHD